MYKTVQYSIGNRPASRTINPEDLLPTAPCTVYIPGFSIQRSISLETVLKAVKLECSDANFQIAGYSVTILGSRYPADQSWIQRTAEFSELTIRMLRNLGPGEILGLYDIRVKDKKGKLFKVESVFYKIIETSH